MNVNDFNVEIPPGDMLETIFSHQRQLMDRYHSIEEKNVGHLVPSTPCEYGPHCGPLDINDRASQLQMKSFAWRITEEITEATLALEEADKTHYLEELIDALHFSVELLIMSGLSNSALVPFGDRDGLEFLFMSSAMDVTENRSELKYISYSAIEKLGEAMNRLKLKPWKTTALVTDEGLYKNSVRDFFFHLIDLLQASGFTSKSATAMYLNKNAVNQFRIESKY